MQFWNLNSFLNSPCLFIYLPFLVGCSLPVSSKSYQTKHLDSLLKTSHLLFHSYLSHRRLYPFLHRISKESKYPYSHLNLLPLHPLHQRLHQLILAIHCFHLIHQDLLILQLLFLSMSPRNYLQFT